VEHRRLGESNLEVSVLCLGSWLTFEYLPREAAQEVLAAAVDAGINFLDDARYDDHTGRAPMKTGWSEVLFGELFRAGGWKRDGFVFANKLWFEFWPTETVAAELEGSLRRLGTDWIDLVYCAPPPASLPLDELLPALEELIVAGKLRSWGVLNWPPALLERAARLAADHGLSRPSAAQLPHNLLDRGFVEGPSAARVLAASGTSVVASHCLAGGLLTGKYNDAGAQRVGRLAPERIESLRQRGVLDRVAHFAALAAAHGATPAQVALAFSLTRPGVAAACFGARSPAQLREDVATLDALPRLRPALEELAAGPPPDDPPEDA
jgi:aryl-alcohol dehydrogenase-like predicted oxidoreductase